MTRPLALAAPAKLNLLLKVRHLRSDGYHNIITLFERIDLSDTVILTEKECGITLDCGDKAVPAGKRNIAYRAARLIRRRFGVRRGIHIRIVKRIPVAAGLGGGSSDAASVLLGLERLWGLDAGLDTLMKLGAELGADVPFFLAGSSFALGLGRGDDIRPVSSGLKLWNVIVRFPFFISSKEAYGRLACGTSDRMIPFSLKGTTLAHLDKALHNDLERGLLDRYPVMLKVKAELESMGGCKGLVSGSGPCVFTILKARKEAYRLWKALRMRGRDAFVARTL